MTAFLIPPWAQPLAAYSILIEPPTEEPLTVEEAKLRAAMNWPVTDPPDPREAMFTDFIKAARSKVEQDTGLALLTQTREVHFDYWTDYVPLPPQCTPVQEITAVLPAGVRRDPGSLFGPWHVDSSRRAARYVLAPMMGRARLAEYPPSLAMTLATPTTGVFQVKAGWPSLAALKGDAPLLVHAVGLLVTHYATLGRDLAITGAVAAVNSVPETYDAVIEPYRLVWMP